MKALGLVVFREDDFFMFFPMMPPGGARMGPRGTVGRIYKEDLYTLLHTKYESSGPCDFGEEDFFMFFPIVCLWELMTPWTGPFLTPGAWLAGFIKKTTTHCYIENMKALGLLVSEKKVFFYVSYDATGAGPIWTPGARLAGFIKRTIIHCYTQNMKALGLVVLEKKIFFMFFHCKSKGAICCHGNQT